LCFPKIKKEEWMSIKGIGEKSAQSLSGWFGDENNLKLLRKMENLGVGIIFQEGPSGANEKIVGKTFVLTGELKNFTRDRAKDIIRKAGGEISSSVSKKTDFVVFGENPGSKYDKARELGIKMVSEGEFEELLK
jgi:DNA ligase (NAD+)